MCEAVRVASVLPVHHSPVESHYMTDDTHASHLALSFPSEQSL